MKPKTNMLFQIMVLVALVGTGIIMSCNMTHTSKSAMKTDTAKGKQITVTGTALHAKAGAVVETPEAVYYIRNKQDWGELYNKKVKVTGMLETENHAAEDLKDENGNYSQGFSGPVNYITLGKVEVVK